MAVFATVTAVLPPAAWPAQGLPGLGRPAPDLAAILLPAQTPPGVYEVLRSDRPIAELAEKLRRADPSPAPGAWTAAPEPPLDAFGAVGRYDRHRLARLFGGRRPLVARGSLVRGEERLAFTLIAPIPSADLSRLDEATLVLVLHVAPGQTWSRVRP